MNKKIFIIAEAGVNHNGDAKIARKMVDAAVKAGADAVKFQSFKAENLVIPSNESQFEMLKRLELSQRDFMELASYCRRKKILFMASPFDEESVDFLDELGMEIFKIPSGEITNKPLLQRIALKKKPIMLSTGMACLAEVEKALGWIDNVWEGFTEKPRLTLLHCVSEYPAPLENVNLTAMRTLESTFNLPAGYSDHTLGMVASIAAAAIGARVIEKHLTLDREMEGPDHRSSLDPDELKKMVTAIRNVEKALGSGIKKPTQPEEGMKNIFRRSLIAARDIRAGAIIEQKDLAIKRPGSGIPPEFMQEIVNRKALYDIKKNSLFQKSHFSRH